jgi:hypothetical protein
MAVTPGQRPESGTLNSTASGSSGTASGGDPTNQPGQYPPGSFFGITVPSGTGAPGTAGVNPMTADDPTISPGQNTPTLGGESPSSVVQTGAPGSQGAPPDGGPETGNTVRYTRPGSWLTGTYQQDTVRQEQSGTGDDTQANDVGYGTSGPQLPALKGNQPTSTGAGQGRVMRGGRSVR